MKIIYLIFISTLFITVQFFAQATSSTIIKLPTTDNTSSFKITSSSNDVGLKINADAGFYLGGTFANGSIPIEGEGTRLMWYPRKSAFRVGKTSGTEWDDSTIGTYSIATGVNNKASGTASTAMGYSTIASGNTSTAMGIGTIASGYISTAMGTNTIASGDRTTSMGYKTTAQAYCSLVLGKWNVTTGTTDSWVATEPVLVVGNGSSITSCSNALTLLKNGNMTIAGALTEHSDKRLKENITPLKSVLNSFEKITPVYYNFIDKQSHPSSRQIGLLAQEIEPLFPELISKDSQGFLSLDYSKMTAVLMKAIKEQQEIINDKNDELKKVENRVMALEKTLSEQQYLINNFRNEFNELKKVLYNQSKQNDEFKNDFTLNK